YRRGVVVGDDHTFGKGSVQTVAPLPPGLGALKLTTAMFFRPGGRSTQQSGVKADIVPPSLTQIPDFGEQYQPYSLPETAIAPFHSAAAAGVGAPGGFQPVDAATLQRLAERSRARIAADERFIELEQEIAKQRENQGVVRVADLLEKNGDGENGGGGIAGDDTAM